MARDFGGGIDAADAQVWNVVLQRAGHMGGGVGGGEQHPVAAPGEAERHGRGNGGLADAAFAHGHHHAVAGGGQSIDEPAKAGRQRDVRRRHSRRQTRRRGWRLKRGRKASRPTMPRATKVSLRGSAASPAGMSASAAA
jgi:hypothetical protein